MSGVPRAGDLELDQDLRQQQREWYLQRIGWAAMALVVLAALAGLSGKGPLSGTAATSADGALRVEYNRFARHHAPDELRLRVESSAARDGELRLWVDQEYLDAVEVQSLTPSPLRVEAARGRQTFVFRVEGDGAPVVVTFRLEPDHPGWLSGRAGVGGGEPVSFRQFVYP